VPTTLSVAETTQNAGFTTEDKHKIAVSNPELVPKGELRVKHERVARLTSSSCCV
jgi:3-oxoacid CoA-transferase